MPAPSSAGGCCAPRRNHASVRQGARRLQPPHQQPTLREDRGDLGDVGQRRAPFGQVARQVPERRPLVLRVALLRVQLDELAGLRERDERDLERSLLGGSEVPGREGALESRAGMALRGHEHTFSHPEPFRAKSRTRATSSSFALARDTRRAWHGRHGVAA